MMNISDLLSILWERDGAIKDTPNVIKAENRLRGFMTQKGIAENEYDEYINRVAAEREEQGFVNGFRCAVGLLMDRGNIEGGIAV